MPNTAIKRESPPLGLLDRPATLADVIGWAVSFPVALGALGWSLVLFRTGYVERFGEIYANFGDTVVLSPETKFVLAVGDFGLAATLALIGILPITILICSRRSILKVVMSLVAAILLVSLSWFVVAALYEPAVRIMNSLPEDTSSR